MIAAEGYLYIRVGRCTVYATPVASVDDYNKASDDARSAMIIISLGFNLFNCIHSSEGHSVH